MTTTPCTFLPGWGSGQSFGSASWSGTTYDPNLVFLPIFPPFDVFCFGPCGNFAVIDVFPEVTLTPSTQITYDGAEDLLKFWSPEGAVESSLTVQTGIPDTFTAEFKICFHDIPANFSDPDKYIKVGAGSHQGYLAGLAFSAIGVAFFPNPDDVHAPAEIPGSDRWGIVLGETYIVRVAVAYNATFIYLTRYADYVLYGHTLRCVLPNYPASSADPPYIVDRAWFRIKGVGSIANTVDLGKLCVSSQSLVENYPPIADPGVDQAARFCSIVQLDGSKSTDYEGHGLQYSWRLIDTPIGSNFAFEGLDGQTFPLTPVATGYTDRWYVLDEEVQVRTGDVLLVAGTPYSVIDKEYDPARASWFIRVTLEAMPDSLALQAYKILYQNGISGAGTQKPTFYPDTTGFYKFDLTVWDGALYSRPAEHVVNVLASVTPRGLTPDLSFLWSYLSDFWKLMDDRERYASFWSSLAQFAASQLLNLWQYEYSKSLRDIQRTFQRKWLSYPILYTPMRTVSALRILFEPYDSLVFNQAADLNDKVIVFSLPDEATVAVRLAALTGKAYLTPVDVAAQIQRQLPSGFTVSVIPRPQLTPADPAISFVRVAAVYPFSVTGSNAAEFPAAEVRGTINGTGGILSSDGMSYQTAPDILVGGLGLVENDFLELGGTLYRIARVVNTTVLRQVEGHPAPVPVRTSIIYLKDKVTDAHTSWSIPSYFTYAEADFYRQLASNGDDAVIEVTDPSSRSLYRKVPVIGAATGDPTALAVDLSPLAVQLQATGYSLVLSSVYRRSYLPISPLVSDIPYLQEVLVGAPDEEVLRRNLDYFLDTYRNTSCIHFAANVWVTPDASGNLATDYYPPNALWAEMTYIDNRPNIENNFGLPVNFTIADCGQLNNVDYLSAVQGLWHSYFNGPRVAVLKAGVQILMGLPFAEADGVILEIRNDFMASTARMLIQDSTATQIVRQYSYPASLPLYTNPATGQPYAVGDTVIQFSPLVRGIEVVDYVSDPKWITIYASEGAASVLQQFFRFLLRVDSRAFTLSAMMFARDFMLKVKPTYTYPIFSVLYDMPETSIDVTDTTEFTASLRIFDTPCGGMNIAAMWDQPVDGWDDSAQKPPPSHRLPMGETIMNAYDVNCEHRHHNAPDSLTGWGMDSVAPVEWLFGILRYMISGPMPVQYDSIFSYDTPVYDDGVSPRVYVPWTYDQDPFPTPVGHWSCDHSML